MLPKRFNLITIHLAILFLGVHSADLHDDLRKQHSLDVAVKVVGAKDMEKILDKYPNAIQLVASYKRTEAVNTAAEKVETYDLFSYTLGARVYGDELVGHEGRNYSWLQPQDVRMTTSYPSNGVGAIVTSVEIIVNQSSRLGSAYVISGGIGQRFITIVVEAESTYWFEYETFIYGVY